MSQALLPYIGWYDATILPPRCWDTLLRNFDSNMNSARDTFICPSDQSTYPDDETRSYAMNRAYLAGIINWPDDSPSGHWGLGEIALFDPTPPWAANLYRLPDPSGTFMYVEFYGNGQLNWLGGDTCAAADNQEDNLYVEHQGTACYSYCDGHVKILRPKNTISNIGTLAKPCGAWTRIKGD